MRFHLARGQSVINSHTLINSIRYIFPYDDDDDISNISESSLECARTHTEYHARSGRFQVAAASDIDDDDDDHI